MAVPALIPHRTTRDLDLLIAPAPRSAARVREALREWGGFEPEDSVEEFLPGDMLTSGGRTARCRDLFRRLC